MTINFLDFMQQILSNKTLAITVILVLSVILVNGWTDAPNAIATCVSTRAIGVKPAILMAAIFNFLGVFVMTYINSTVAQTIFDMVDFSGDSKKSLIALCAALIGIVLWATIAWIFGIPTSESHALIAGLSGAAIALQEGMSGINKSQWIKVIYGLVLSTFLGYFLGYITSKGVEYIGRLFSRRKVNRVLEKLQVGSGAAMAFMHGAQDGQKFMGVFMLGIFLVDGDVSTKSFEIPVWIMLISSLVMALGTSIGGYRIIKTVGMGMVKLDTYQGFASDLAAAFCLFLSSMLSFPVSTTHTKTTSIMGVGAAKNIHNVNWSLVKDMVFTWILTFPGCGILGYSMVYLLMKIF